MRNYIQEYQSKIESGEIVVGEFIRTLYGMITEGIANGKYVFKPKRAELAISYIENFCHHHEGKLAPGLLHLELWQKAFLSLLFGIYDHNGFRQFTECLLIIARKNGKTLLASAISSYMLFADGEYGARVYFAAPKLAQATLCFSALQKSIENEPELKHISRKRRLDIYVAETNSTAMPVAFNSKTADGLNPSMVVSDEIAAWPGDRGKKQYEVYMSAFGARENPEMLSITTAGYEVGGIYDELMTRATRILKGGSTEEHFLPVLYIVDDESRWDDINELKKSNPNMGISVQERTLLNQIDVAHNSLSKKIEFLTKVCNVPQNSQTAWLSNTAVKDCMGDALHLGDFAECYCVAGVDLSQSVDLTAACIILEREKQLYCFAHFWIPGAKLAECTERDKLPYDQYIQRGIVSLSGENVIDTDDVFEWFKALVEQAHIYPLWVGYDRYTALPWVKKMQAYGFHCDSVFQGTNLTGIINETEGIITDRRLHIGDNDLLAIHLLNATLATETASNRKKLAKAGKGRHIDGAACILDAVTMRQAHYEEIGGQLLNERGDEDGIV